MAIQISLRNSTSAAWSSTNPTLAQGEVGVTTDTNQFKIGDGATAWNSLLNAGGAGVTQTNPYRSLGDGSDGNVIISSGVTTLVRDMFYNNLTINGTGQIFCNCYRIFVKGILDLTNAPVGAINANGANGGAASGAIGGTVATVPASASLGTGGQSTAGVTGTTGVGATASTQTALTGNGGISNTSGAGGTGTNAGGVGRGGATPTAADFRRYETNFLRGVVLVGGGQSGGGGGSGGGDGTNLGGGGGGGANGGGIVALYANIILKSSATPIGVIQANGGTGGAGGSATAGICGGGGGGAGGAGGWVYIVYNTLAGPFINSALQAGGGGGGNGGNGFGAGAIGGSGGLGGYGGRILVYQIGTINTIEYQASPALIYGPEVISGNGANILIGGAGAPGDSISARKTL
jgi:hypothetical protein